MRKKSIWNKLINMLKKLTEGTQREKNIPVAKTTTLVISIVITGNNDGK